MPTSKKSFELVLDRLKEEGFRLTSTRKDLVEAILLTKGHWRIQDIQKSLEKKLPKVGTATLYRTVHLLAQLGYLTETKAGMEAARYEFAQSEHHDHLTCRQCNHIFEFENEEIERLQAQVAKRLGFSLAHHQMELYGNCERKPCPYNKSSRHSSK